MPRPGSPASTTWRWAQPLTLFHESVLFYRSLLGLLPLESQELASPNGLIRSQALAGGAGKAIRLVLNVPVLGGGRAAQRPVQHVAIRSADITETARYGLRPGAFRAARSGQLLRGPRRQDSD